jgi:hypothetical protein
VWETEPLAVLDRIEAQKEKAKEKAAARDAAKL